MAVDNGVLTAGTWACAAVQRSPHAAAAYGDCRQLQTLLGALEPVCSSGAVEWRSGLQLCVHVFVPNKGSSSPHAYVVSVSQCNLFVVIL